MIKEKFIWSSPVNFTRRTKHRSLMGTYTIMDCPHNDFVGTRGNIDRFCANNDALIYSPFFIRCHRSWFFSWYNFVFNLLVQDRERGRATAVLLLALPIGGLIGAPASTWILDNISWLGMAGWRWMFILEGIPAIIIGIIVVFYLTNRPANAKWLSKEENDWLEGELSAERKVSSSINKVTKLDMLKDSKIWKLALFYFAGYTSIYGLSFWMPTIIKSLSENATTNLEIGWLAMIPSLVGIPAIMFVGWNSDRTNEHKSHLLVCLMIAVVGFIGCGFSNSVFMLVLMLTITSFGLYGFSGCFFAYMTFFFTESLRQLE